MKRWIIGILTVAAVWGLPKLSHPAADIGKLKPVEVIQIIVVEESVTIRTDSGDYGTGENLTAALEKLRESADGEVFLDTADQLILTGNPTGEWQSIFEMLRPSSGVCVAGAETDLEQAAKYLAMHPPKVTLRDLRAGEGTPEHLIMEGERGRLETG